MAYKRILVPVDGSATSKAGLREAIGIAKGQKASLQLVHVVDYHAVAMSGLDAGAYLDRLIDGLTDSGKRILQRAEEQVRKSGVPVTSVLLESPAGPAADAIVRQAKKAKADLIVIGTHGRRGVRRLLMGSDAEQVVRNAPVPVMLVRAPDRQR
ncbi:MAG TPA: universal stress protein [Burkholderiales bacterium]